MLRDSDSWEKPGSSIDVSCTIGWTVTWHGAWAAAAQLEDMLWKSSHAVCR